MVEERDSKNRESNNEGNIPKYFVEDDFQYFGHLEDDLVSSFSWKRIIEVIDDPCLLESHDTFNDGYIICGSQSARWFPVLYVLFRSSKDIMKQVVRDIKLQDNYNKSTYDGSFEFSFFGLNQWTDIRIDDRLPFPPEGQKTLISVSSNKEEFLPQLLEKAYARFLGGYGKFPKIDFIEAVMHFTGGIIEEVPQRRNLDPMPFQDQRCCFKKFNSISQDTVILCQTTSNKSCKEDPNLTKEKFLPVNHYYLVTGLSSVPLKSRSNLVLNVLASIVDYKNTQETVDLIRLHNPVITGDWSGSYNLGSQEWEGMSEHVRNHYNLNFKHEFEFWISMNDFCKNMSAVIFCLIPNDRIVDSLLKSVTLWHYFNDYGHYGISIPDGNIEDLGKNFLTNDQYLIDVAAVKEDNIKAVLHVESADSAVIFNEGCGITILKVENNRCYRLHDVINTISLPYTVLSSTSTSFSICLSLLRGRYVLLPWRNGKDDVGYFLRIYYTHKSITISALKDNMPPFVECFTCSVIKTVNRAKDSIITTISKDNGQSQKVTKERKCPSCISVNPAEATRITVVSGEDLEISPNKTRSNSYFVLRCGNYYYKSSVKTLTNEPLWNDDFIFYRVDTSKELISVEVFYEENFGFDKSLGIHTFNQCEISRAGDGYFSVSLNLIHNKELIPTSSKIRVKFKTFLPSEFNNV